MAAPYPSSGRDTLGTIRAALIGEDRSGRPALIESVTIELRSINLTDWLGAQAGR